MNTETGEIREITEAQPINDNEMVLTEAEAQLLNMMTQGERVAYLKEMSKSTDEQREQMSQQIMTKALNFAKAKAKYEKKHMAEVQLPPLGKSAQWRERKSQNAADIKRLKRTGALKRMRNG